MRARRDLPLAIFIVFGTAAFALPLGESHSWLDDPMTAGLWLAALTLGATLLREAGPPHPSRLQGRGSLNVLSPRGDEDRVRGDFFEALVAMAAAAMGAIVPIRLLASGVQGQEALGLWAAVLALCFVMWRAMERAATLAARHRSRGLNLVAPGIFGLWILYLWQVLTDGFAIPPVLLPSPSLIGKSIAGAQDTLVQDFLQTVVKCVIPGYLMGNLAGFATALLVDRFSFMKRGLLPVGNLFSSLPIVGLAPIMVMWFGFDWQSKAAIVVIMTFFPMLVNTISGLAETSQIERDLMQTYAASYWQTMLAVRLPAALPFIFNALKINSTLALIGAIVAEFFGGPTYGIGFRITAEAGRMNIAMVWAAIAVAAASGSAFYGLLALLERRATFWHPSFRQRA
jgi:NitT/TauT family transport system permease protein